MARRKPIKTNSFSYPQYSRRDRLAGRHRIPYHNPMLTVTRVEQVFGYYMDSDEYIDRESDEYIGSEREEDDAMSISVWDDDPNKGFCYEGQQLELDLKNVEELENEHRKMIVKYQRAIEYMGAEALLWHDLMMDIKANPQLQAEFDKFQLIRKLSGGTL